jgi:hypothetical protein
LVGNGDGSFQVPQAYAVGKNPDSVAVADFNADGTPDLAVANVDSQTVSVLLGQGNGSFFVPVNYNVGGSSYSVAVGDVNGNGFPDLVVGTSLLSSAGSGSVTVLLNADDWSTGSPALRGKPRPAVAPAPSADSLVLDPLSAQEIVLDQSGFRQPSLPAVDPRSDPISETPVETDQSQPGQLGTAWTPPPLFHAQCGSDLALDRQDDSGIEGRTWDPLPAR